MKEIYCTECGKLNKIEDNSKFCSYCGKELNFNDDSEKVSIAKKFIEKKSGIIFCLILVPIVTMAISIALMFIPYEVIYSVLFCINGIALSVLFDWLIVYAYNKDKSYPEDVIYYNEKFRSLEVYTKKGYKNISLETINKLVVHDYIFISTGKAVIPVQVKYGTIVFKLSDGSKISTITIDEVRNVKEKINELVTYN